MIRVLPLAFLLLATAVRAQPATIAGRITDATNRGTAASLDGRYLLAGLDARVIFDASAEAALPVTVGGARLRGLVVVRNLADEVYVAARRPAGVRPGLPRTVLVGLRVEM